MFSQAASQATLTPRRRGARGLGFGLNGLGDTAAQTPTTARPTVYDAPWWDITQWGRDKSITFLGWDFPMPREEMPYNWDTYTIAQQGAWLTAALGNPLPAQLVSQLPAADQAIVPGAVPTAGSKVADAIVQTTAQTAAALPNTLANALGLSPTTLLLLGGAGVLLLIVLAKK